MIDEIKAINPNARIYAFALIMRCPKYSSADEEPDYYEFCGEEIFRTGQTKHKLQLGAIDPTEAENQMAEYAPLVIHSKGTPTTGNTVMEAITPGK